MKTEDDIKYMLEKLKQTVKVNKEFLRDGADIFNLDYEEIEEDNYKLNIRIKMLEWVLMEDV